ncbi:hypothetical protein DNTS_022783 [Danionella cerebrum]|uniref:Immunoglobulin subtype domain-containing protein n=1 Tax=Danionella cerebrum TaxID=2873325 RepID=A0A553QDH1_9TELE|nr:hypothetical protein DNTS_022783 [Danionella translucida]
MNCDLEEKEVFWIVLKSPDPPTQILGSFSSEEESPHYFNKSFRSKYSVQFKHRLVINNISADELGVYFCMSTRSPPKFSNSSRIYLNITDTHQRNSFMCSNHTQNQGDGNQKECWIITATSAAMNGFFLFVIIGLVKVFVLGDRRSGDDPGKRNAGVQQTEVQDEDQLQYAAVDFSVSGKKIRSSQEQSTYAMLNLPTS